MNTHVARNPIGATAGHRLPPFDFAAKPRGSCAGASTDGHSQTPNDSYLESTRLYLGKWVQVSIYLFFCFMGSCPMFFRTLEGPGILDAQDISLGTGLGLKKTILNAFVGRYYTRI